MQNMWRYCIEWWGDMLRLQKIGMLIIYRVCEKNIYMSNVIIFDWFTLNAKKIFIKFINLLVYGKQKFEPFEDRKICPECYKKE